MNDKPVYSSYEEFERIKELENSKGRFSEITGEFTEELEKLAKASEGASVEVKEFHESFKELPKLPFKKNRSGGNNRKGFKRKKRVKPNRRRK